MNTLKLIKKTIKYWYLILIAGLLLIGVGLWAIIFSSQSITAIAVVFSLTFLIVGLFETIFAISNINKLDGWGWELALGIIKFVLGLILLINPHISALTLAFYVGFLILFRSLSAIIIALDLKRYRILQWGNLLGLGIIGFVLALLLLFNPHLAVMTIIVCISLSLIVSGIISIYLSLKIRKIKSLAQKISADLISRYEALKKDFEDIFIG